MITRRSVKDLAGILVSPPVDPRRQEERIDFMEENVLLPVKAMVVGFLFYILYPSGAFAGQPQIGDMPMSTLRLLFWSYVGVFFVGALFLLFMRSFPIVFVQWVVCAINLLDAGFLAAMTVLTGAMKDFTYWAFLGLILRNAVSVPVAWLQIPLNILTIAIYVIAGIMDKALVDIGLQRMDWEGVSRSTKTLVSDLTYLQAFVMQVLLMLLWMACCYGVQILLDRQREAEEELREHVVRQEQLQTAGRLAAEIAHRIKNPLAIINNAVFSLQRGIKEGKGDPGRQLQLIRDEIERSDRIITELMGYAQLAEGQIEKLDVIDEMELAIEQAFPPGAKYATHVHRHYEPGVPSIQMQRGHLRDILVNLLHNAREVLNGQGNVHVYVRSDTNYTVTIIVQDDGPGIPKDRVERIFEPYYTTKTKGTGLGLAIVKHNAEIYGGHAAVESALGSGATFVVQIPAKTMQRLRK